MVVSHPSVAAGLLLIQLSKTIKSLLNTFPYINFKNFNCVMISFARFSVSCLFFSFISFPCDKLEVIANAKTFTFSLRSKIKMKEAVWEAGMRVCMCVGERQWMKRTCPREAGRGTHNHAGIDVGLLESAKENKSSLIDYQHLRSGAAAREAQRGVAPTPPI